MTIHLKAVFQVLLLLGAANGAPILCKRLLGSRLATPIDGGFILRDGQPLLGRSKTWRGVIAAIVLATCAAWLVRLPWQAGALAGAFAMVGDCLSSFAKRRLRLEPSSMALGLDQIPESLLPTLVCSAYLPIGLFDIFAITLLFLAGELALSRLLFAFHLRDRPY
jgi:hypothetical protein